MEIINGIDQDDTGGDCTNIDGAIINNSVIGGTTPAAGNFTVLKASTDPTDADGVGDQGFNDGRYCLEANNLSDVGNAATSFGNIKQAATDSATGVSQLATDAITVTGTATNSVTTPANITAKMAAPGVIGGTTPASGVFTTLESTGQLCGALTNNQMAQKATFDILSLMVDPRFLNLQCEDPGAGTMTDVSSKGHDGTYNGSMTTGDRVKHGMGWSLDIDASNDYVALGDHNDFSFGNGTNDEEVTFFGVCQIVASASTQRLITKHDRTSGSESREYKIEITPERKFSLEQVDESNGFSCSRICDSAISEDYHSFAITSPGDGGATAMNNVKIYIDGVIVASTASNHASYVAMENLTVQALIGASVGTAGIITGFFNGDISMIGMDGYEWTAYDIHRFHQLCKGLYGL